MVWNVDKCQVMYFGKKMSLTNTRMLGKPLVEVQEEKDLSVN